VLLPSKSEASRITRVQFYWSGTRVLVWYQDGAVSTLEVYVHSAASS